MYRTNPNPNPNPFPFHNAPAGAKGQAQDGGNPLAPSMATPASPATPVAPAPPPAPGVVDSLPERMTPPTDPQNVARLLGFLFGKELVTLRCSRPRPVGLLLSLGALIPEGGLPEFLRQAGQSFREATADLKKDKARSEFARNAEWVALGHVLHARKVSSLDSEALVKYFPKKVGEHKLLAAADAKSVVYWRLYEVFPLIRQTLPEVEYSNVVMADQKVDYFVKYERMSLQQAVKAAKRLPALADSTMLGMALRCVQEGRAIDLAPLRRLVDDRRLLWLALDAMGALEEHERLQAGGELPFFNRHAAGRHAAVWQSWRLVLEDYPHAAALAFLEHGYRSAP